MDEHATYDQAVEIWKAEGKMSVCLLQRRLHIGYGRAVNLYNDMIASGIFNQPKG